MFPIPLVYVGLIVVANPSFPRTILPFEVSSMEIPGPLISKAQSGRVNIRTTQQIGRSWQERFLVNVRSVDGRALLASVNDYWRNGTIFAIDHRDHVTPLGTGGGSPLINQSPQLVSSPENFSAWTTSGTIGVTGGQTDPYGGTAAYILDSNTPSSNDVVFLNVTYTADATKSASCFFRTFGGQETRFAMYDFTASTFRHRIKLLWDGNGVPTPSTTDGSGTIFSVEPFPGNWYRVSISATGVIAANTNRLYVYADFTGGGSATYVFGANAWNAAAPSGYIGPSHLAATGNRFYVDGATASVSNWLRAGDLVSVAGLLPAYEVTANVNSEAGGYASIPVNPPIFTGGAPTDNAAVTITGVTMSACILEPPTFPSTSGSSADYGELVVKFSESL